jgi:hypothetical protein
VSASRDGALLVWSPDGQVSHRGAVNTSEQVESSQGHGVGVPGPEICTLLNCHVHSDRLKIGRYFAVIEPMCSCQISVEAPANHNSCMKTRPSPGPCTTACDFARFEGHAPFLSIHCLCPISVVAQPGGPLCADRGQPPDWRSLRMRPGHRPEPAQPRHVWGGQGAPALPASAAQ